MGKVKLSVVIPVHNGEKYIRKTVHKILKQDLKDIEVVLVENFSKDNSKQVCNELQQLDERVIVTSSEDMGRGTSFARKRGVELAQGEYIVFSDQDDSYVNKRALGNMLKAIEEDNSDICQFSAYIDFFHGIKYCRRKYTEKIVLTREELFAGPISGAWDGKNYFTTSVWSKIYRSSVLKSAINGVVDSLFFSEDMYLNIFAFFDENVKSVSYRPEAYYVWKKGIGFSSGKNSLNIMMDEYHVIKKYIINFIEKNNLSDALLYNTHLESLYFYKALICNMINEKKADIIETIQKYDNYNHIQCAKQYFRNLDATKRWSELDFLISDYSAEEYYNYCISKCK